MMKELDERKATGLMTAAPSLFPPSSILIFNQKLAVALMCITTLLALVHTILNLQNFLPSG